MEHISDARKAINRIIAWKDHLKLPKNKLAADAGLAESTLRSFGKKYWNPTVETLEKLEAAIPQGLPPHLKKDNSSPPINTVTKKQQPSKAKQPARQDKKSQAPTKTRK